jgi:8-oxo-dGTP diphosphatase
VCAEGKTLIQREFPSQPLVGAGAVVVDGDGRVLLVRRARPPLQGHWSLPGGLIELGETLLEGVQREVAEETGLIVEPQAVVEVVDRIYYEEGPEMRNSGSETGSEAPELPRVRYHYVIVDYWCRVQGGVLQPSSDASEVAWVTRAEWNDLNLYSLETITVQVIEKGWQMARRAGNHHEEKRPVS